MRSHLVQVTSKITALARSGHIACARNLFDEMPHRDSIAWNTMLTGYSQLGLYDEALSLFHQMRITDTRPDHFSFTSILSACAGALYLQYGQKIHGLVFVLGYNSSLPVNNALIDMYGKCSCPFAANKVFQEMGLRNNISWCSLLFAYVNGNDFCSARQVVDAMPERVDIAWNTIIAGHARIGEIKACFDLFEKMIEESGDPDQWTLSALMNACTESREFRNGCTVHALIVKTGWGSAVEATNSLLSFYTKLGTESDVLKMLESTGTVTQVSWNAIIDAHMKLGNTQKALIAFQMAPEKNVISWTSMISGYAKNSHEQEAISFYLDAIRSGIKPDKFTFGAVLHACSILTNLGNGKMIHGSVIRYGFHECAYVGNGIVNMYAKCGDIQGSSQAFDDVLVKDLVSFNTMLLAFGLHGLAHEALKVYEEITAFGLKPDKVTFIGLLMTCSHLGLVEKGLSIFKSMESVYGITPEMDHVNCLVDMLARGGNLEEAREVASKYIGGENSTKMDSFEAVFGACYAYEKLETGLKIGENLRSLDPKKEMSYVVLSNLYSTSGKWKEAEAVRKAMTDNGVKKIPGYSWVEVNNNMTPFVAGKHSNQNMQDLYSFLDFLDSEMKHPLILENMIK